MKANHFPGIVIMLVLSLCLPSCLSSPSSSVTIHSAGDQHSITADDVGFNLVYVPAMSFSVYGDSANPTSLTTPFWIGETEVTYRLWSTVYDWAIQNGYQFVHEGTMGDGEGDNNQHPVTTVNWRDCIVWCNSATEWHNAVTGVNDTCVYTLSGEILRNSNDDISCDSAEADPDATGFRLPLSSEWELAASFVADNNSDGDILDENESTPGNYASGATADYTDAEATGEVAWYEDNSGGGTHEVKGKKANGLGLYDMSGNVGEWCFDGGGGRRIGRLGTWLYPAEYQQITSKGGGFPPDALPYLGFRIVKNM